MPRQIINLGTSPNDRTGDKLRDAGTKLNSNFTELYSMAANLDLRVSSLETANTDIDLSPIYAEIANTQSDIADLTVEVNNLSSGGSTSSWNDPVANVGFSVVNWVSGATVTIGTTPFEFANAVTFDAQTDSSQIRFVWDQNFIDNVWDGGASGIEGENFSISLDGGTTWYQVENGGYSGGSQFYFNVPFVNDGLYTFTYTAGQSAIIRFNRGNTFEPWFDLANAPVANANNVLFASMKVFARASGIIANNAVYGYKYFDNFSLGLTIDPVTNQGFVNYGQESDQGNQTVANAINIRARFNNDPHRIYCTYNYFDPGEITVFWDAKLFVRN